MIKKGRVKINRFILAVFIPVMGFFTIFGFWPIIYNFYLTFIRTKIVTKGNFAGFNNYIEVFSNPVFRISIRNTILYCIGLVVIGIVTSLIIAVSISKTKGLLKKIFIACYFAPVVTSLVATSIIWKILYYPNSGVINVILNFLHLPMQSFLFDYRIALISILIMDIWKDTGLRTMILLAAIEEIPDTVYEASLIDGANPLQQFFKITVPLLKPQLLFLAVIYTINGVQTFTQVYIMTSPHAGGPGNSTMVLALDMYKKAFGNLRFGYGAVVSVVMLLLLIGFTITQVKSRTEWEW
ncbi:MAG: sugar ABC transporter permease [Actinobacteria bacterium]|nr:sugar ABC transporter permease [Actinomycetota bacterium]